ncbi:muscle M-line assembly protein unc-89-like isoform X1 [Oreochromis aureus]|uniref:Ig-like domain-containing protein n=1 Tax=Oreochromis aureus TaxID=47969 RepID=A0AAZ1XH04_OREAU|nr:muscle M-line assembly protein unc-89-like isoform X1 [Oreochromis aureus]
MQLMLLLLLLASQHASAVEVYEGVESVRLPCHVPADVALESTAAVWDREDLNIKIVHVRLRSSDDFKEQSIRYTNRTSMRADALQTGDLSLTLRNPTVSDSGTYKCTVRKYGRDQSKTYVDLKITVRPPPVWPIVLFALLVPVVLLAAAFGVFMYPRYKMLKMRKEYQLEMVEVTQGKEFVLLPFKIKEGFTQDVKVEWKHKNKMVHEYQIGKDQCHLKGQDQKQRTEMKKDPLNTKDLSLTLKDLHLTDSGVYTCTIYNKDGHMLLRKSVTLSVRVPEVQMVETVKGVQSVLLPFTTDIKLQDVTVEWKHEDRKVPQGRAEMKKDPLRTGDFSLTLKDLHLTDSGVYTCTVYNKDGHMLLQKAVTLSVRDYQSVVVEVTQGQKSVLMPFKITGELPQVIKVEWKLTHPEEKMVHCNDSSQKQDQVYVGRTEMPHYDLKSKDFSLTLKDLHLTDSGVYTCTVYNKDGHMLLQKSVTLSVRVPEVQMVETVKGVQSVLLPFTTDIKLQDVTVEWKHEDKKVHVYQGDQNQSYIQGRTEVKNEQIKNGDLSLTLKDLHLTDSGVYTCTVYNKQGHIWLRKSVTLSVRVPEVQMVETVKGVQSVLLPFTTDIKLQDVTVEWKHEDKKVPQGRAEMKKDPLRTGDFSLTLKDLHLTDSGVYTCTIYNKDGHMLLQKSVTLSVRVLQVEMVEVTQGEKSVLLPFRIKDNLPVDVTLLWRHENVTVHTYQRGQSQPDIQGRTEMKKDPLTTKDLSLTLKDLHLTDSGVYTCTVYNKDGHMLLQKVVTLSVRGDNKTTTTQAAENQHTKKSTGRLTSSTERKK